MVVPIKLRLRSPASIVAATRCPSGGAFAVLTENTFGGSGVIEIWRECDIRSLGEDAMPFSTLQGIHVSDVSAMAFGRKHEMDGGYCCLASCSKDCILLWNLSLDGDSILDHSIPGKTSNTFE